MHQWTDFGRDVLACSVDVHLRILETVCSRFDLRWHGRIAAAYVQRSTYTFLRIKVVDTCGLTSEQVAFGRNAGFIAKWKFRSEKSSPNCTMSTNIAMYFKSVAENTCLDPKRYLGRNGWSSCFALSCWPTSVIKARCCIYRTVMRVTCPLQRERRKLQELIV